jgi:hypothetical protein
LSVSSGKRSKYRIDSIIPLVGESVKIAYDISERRSDRGVVKRALDINSPRA